MLKMPNVWLAAPVQISAGRFGFAAVCHADNLTRLSVSSERLQFATRTSTRSLSDLELYDSFLPQKSSKNDCFALICPFTERFSTLKRLFLPFGQSYPAST